MIKLLFSLRFYLALLLFALIGGLLLFIANSYVFPTYTNYNEGITTPDVTKMHHDDAIATLERYGLRHEVIDRRSNAAYPVNYIIDQNPLPGQLVKPNRKVYLKVNVQNRPKVKVPTVENLSLRNARIQLQNFGLKVGSISYKSSPFKNTVLSQSISDGTEVEKGTAINLVISDGLGVRMITIPDIIGKTLSEAQRLIITSGLRLGAYRYVPSETKAVNTVVGYEPYGEKSVLEGSEIDLIIAEEAKFQEFDESFSINKDSTKNK